MPMLPRLDPRLRRLLQDAGVAVLLPTTQQGAVLDASAQTSRRGGMPELVAWWFRMTVTGQPGKTLDVGTFVREWIVASRGDSEPSGRVVLTYLEREARRDLAMRSLDLAPGQAENGTVPLGERVIERERLLRAPEGTALIADGRRISAQMTRHGIHSATWADLPDTGIATVIYGRAWPVLPELAAIEMESR